jgi:hypothetical protein
MSGLPDALFRRWTHSFEEDEGDVLVYRPREYPFPRARGRAGIEFRPDRTFVDWRIGRGDAGHPVEARWEPGDAGTVRVERAGPAAAGAASEAFELIEVSPDVLRLRPLR